MQHFFDISNIVLLPLVMVQHKDKAIAEVISILGNA